MSILRIVGGPTLIREAICAGCPENDGEEYQLEGSSKDVAPSSSSEAVDTVLLYCDDEKSWSQLDQLVDKQLTVCVLRDPAPESYARALRAGAYATDQDQCTQEINEVVSAARRQKALIPGDVAKQLAERSAALKRCNELNSMENSLLQGLTSGDTIADLARRTSYSERTIRRRLQNLYLKLGVRNRHQAMCEALRLGLVRWPNEAEYGA